MKGRLSESGLSAPLWGEINATCYAGGFLLASAYHPATLSGIKNPGRPAWDHRAERISLNIRLSRSKVGYLLIYFLKPPFLVRNLLV